LEGAKTAALHETLRELLDAKKLKYCSECGICTGSCSVAALLGKDYNPRVLLEKISLSSKDVLASDEPWLCAWCYQCYKRCPQALKLPEIFLTMRIMAIREGYIQSFDKALKKIIRNVPLPFVTLFVCFHPERAGLDRIEVLEKAQRLREKTLGTRKGGPEFGATKGKIAVIGSGPAGLTVAYELRRKGYLVTVFETMSKPGGMLRKCIPEGRLPKQVLDSEIQYLKDLGVDLRTGVTVGKNLDFEDIWREGYKAVFVGVGAHKKSELKVEGGDLKGVMHALDFLWKVNSGEKVKVGKSVVVIGGGNVAIDAARTALELGASEVMILYRRSRDEMPAIPWEINEAENAGVKMEFLVSPKKILGEEGNVSAIECIRMQLGELDETGRPKPIPIESSEFTRKTDMVVLAIGEAPDLAFLPNEIELNENGTLWADPTTMETSQPGVFAGGDAASGPATVIEAIRAGKCAAESIEKYLEQNGE